MENRFIEIWNLVFMQFEQISKDKRIDLPKPSVDTGMGLERMQHSFKAHMIIMKQIILKNNQFCFRYY
jgi:alanyl-tRNA synthetase